MLHTTRGARVTIAALAAFLVIHSPQARPAETPEAAPPPVTAPHPKRHHHARPRSTTLVRENLLQRLVGAFDTRPQPTATATPASASSRKPRSGATLPPAPRRMPMQAVKSSPMDRSEATPPADAAPVVGLSAEEFVEQAAAVAAAEPVRLEFDVRESRALVGEGEQLVMRIAVRNVGGEAAEQVRATLFFAEGIEPVQALGQTAEIYPGEVRFAAIPRIEPGASADLLVTAVGTRPGTVAYRGELECRHVAGRTAHEGAVTVQARKVTER